MDSHKAYRLGVLLVHGIQGRPQQLGFLTERLNGDVHVRNVTLPGHGQTVREFRKSNSQQCLDFLRAECLRLREQCEKIVFVGHSMGCLLGLLVEQEQKIFSGMLLLCCPFYVRPTLRYFRLGFLAACTKRQTPAVQAAREANGVYAKHAFSYLTCLHPYLELLRLMRKTRRQPLSLPDETLFCYAQNDEIVSKKSLRHGAQCLHAKTAILPDCGHSYFSDDAKDDLFNRLCEIIAAKREPVAQRQTDTRP